MKYPSPLNEPNTSPPRDFVPALELDFLEFPWFEDLG